ncbi:MAG: FGGY-family carbohydrate kinase [Thermostichales cyanobacterium DRC_bins_46]
MGDCFLGLDLGTSGLRGMVLAESGNLVADAARNWPQPERDPQVWRQALAEVLGQIRSQLQLGDQIRAVSACSTSGSILPLDRRGQPLSPAILYCDPVPTQPGIPRSWGLAKWRWWQGQFPDLAGKSMLAHPTDWLLQQMGAALGVTDHTNALKSGFDPRTYGWSWQGGEHLPQVVPPGTVIGKLDPDWGLGKGVVVAGLTDGCAAQLAAGAIQLGQVSTSLGTTLIFKATADTYVDSGSLYSHLHPDRQGWLIGGASSSGGGVLRQLFPGADLAHLDQQISGRPPTGIPSYPVVGGEERYPIAGYRGWLPAAEPGSLLFYQALLEGIACIERYGIEQLPLPYPDQVLTTGGACVSRVWLQIRATVLQRPLVLSRYPQPATGAAMVAAAGFWQCSVTKAVQTLWQRGTTLEPGSPVYEEQYQQMRGLINLSTP